MTLIFFKNNKPDTRLADYEKAVVEAGLKKAELEKELEQKRREAVQVDVALDLVREVFRRNWDKLTEEERREIGERTLALDSYSRRVAEEEKRLSATIEHVKKANVDLFDITKRVGVLNGSLDEYERRKIDLESSLSRLSEEREIAEREKRVAVSLRQEAQDGMRVVADDLVATNKRLIDSRAELAKAHRDLEELNEIIAILQATNRDGLDIVKSFDGERKRLSEKEEALLRKEHDLGIYEKRLKKEYHALIGKELTMVFK